MQTLELTNVGPVPFISIPVPEDGGVVILRGRNGRGKTKTLEAVESAISGRGKIEVRDGQLNGEFKGFGVTIKVGRSTRRAGELEVQSLEGKLSVAELVDPGIKSPDAADARRIKALVQLANVLPAADLFYSLVGTREEFEKVVGSSALASDDLVTMAERIKRDLHQAALVTEGQADHAEGRARGAREAAAEVDTSIETDSAKLQTVLEGAISQESALKSQAASAAKARLANQTAKDSLDDAEASFDGPSLDAAKISEKAAKQIVDGAETVMRDAEEALRVAKEGFNISRERYSAAINARKQAEQHEALVKQWREQLAAAMPVAPDPSELAAAAESVAAARSALEAAALARRAKQHLVEAETHATEAKERRKRAELLREAAKGTDEVLSSVVSQSSTLLRVEQGRLVLDTKRGATYFGDLSHGERWKIALDVAIDAVGPRGVLMIPQEAFESLDPTNRHLIKDHVSGRGVVIITAESSDDEEITAELLA